MQPKILNEVYEFEKNSAERVKIILEEFRKKQYADIRIYYDASENAVPNWQPTKKGICISIELLDQLQEGIEKAIAKIESGI